MRMMAKTRHVIITIILMAAHVEAMRMMVMFTCPVFAIILMAAPSSS